MLGQTLSNKDGFILLARVSKVPGNKPAEAIANKAVGGYQGYSLHGLAGTELFQTWIDEQILAIGTRRNLEVVIGVHSGVIGNIQQSAIAAHLDELDSPRPVSFVYSLPALRASVTDNLCRQAYNVPPLGSPDS